MSNNIKELSFVSLLNQYTPGCLLTETKNGIEFKKNTNIFHRFFEFFFPSNPFHIEHSASILTQRAVKALENKLPIEELQAFPQVLLCTQRMLHGIRLANSLQHRSKEREIESLQKIENENLNLVEKAVEKLAEERKVLPFQIYLEMGKHHEFMFETAYKKFIQSPQFDKLSREELQFLANFSWKKGDMDILFKIIILGVSPQNLSQNEKIILLKRALTECDDLSTSTLIKNGFFYSTNKKKDSEFIFECIENGMTESVKALLEKGLDFSIKDDQGLTPLHYYFLLGNIDLAQTIMQTVDPTIKNESNMTPLSCFLSPQTETEKTLKKMNHEVSTFLDSLFLRKEGSFSGVLEQPDLYRRELKKFSRLQPLPLCDIVELTFLIDDDELRKKLFLYVGREPFERSCVELRKKYPKQVVDNFFFSSFSITKTHFMTGCDIITLPQGVNESNDITKLSSLCRDIYNISLSNLKRLTSSFSEKQHTEFSKYFQKIQFHFSSYFSANNLSELKEFTKEEQAKIFIAIKKYRKKTFSSSEENLLSKYLHKVTHRIPFLGTPKEGSSGLESFYIIIENNLKHIVFSLEQKRDADLTASTLREFIAASPKCGGRYFAVAQLQAEKVCLGLEPSPRKLFERSLGSLREECLSGTIADKYRNDTDTDNVHAYNLALFYLGKPLGIPGYQQAFNDDIFRVPFDKDEIFDLFNKSYTIDTIVHGWVLPKLADDVDFRNFYIDLQRELVPDSWRMANQKEPVDRDELIYDFLMRIVYDKDGKFSALGVFSLLERIEVVESKLPKTPASNQLSIYMS